jgi:hypothetical protein
MQLPSNICFRTGSLIACVIGLAATPAANAALGGDAASVIRDHGALRAADVVTLTTQHYDLHEARTADGLQVRQYVDRTSGKVFAITWAGPRSPDIGALLGASAAKYYEAVRTHKGSHHALSIDDPDLSLTLLRLPRGWQGQAYLPSAARVGIDRNEIR